MTRARRLRDVAAAVGQHLVDVLPLDSSERRSLLPRGVRARPLLREDAEDLIDVRGLAEVVARPHADGFERRRHTAATGEHDHRSLGPTPQVAHLRDGSDRSL